MRSLVECLLQESIGGDRQNFLELEKGDTIYCDGKVVGKGKPKPVKITNVIKNDEGLTTNISFNGVGLSEQTVHDWKYDGQIAVKGGWDQGYVDIRFKNDRMVFATSKENFNEATKKENLPTVAGAPEGYFANLAKTIDKLKK